MRESMSRGQSATPCVQPIARSVTRKTLRKANTLVKLAAHYPLGGSNNETFRRAVRSTVCIAGVRREYHRYAPADGSGHQQGSHRVRLRERSVGRESRWQRRAPSDVASRRRVGPALLARWIDDRFY